MKTFQNLFEDVKKADAELSMDDMGEISSVVEMLKNISQEDIESPEETVNDLEYVLDSVNLKFNKKKALDAFESEDEVEIPLSSADEDEGISLNATNEDGEEVPGELVLHLRKNGDHMEAGVLVYFGDEPEDLADIDFEIPEDKAVEYKEDGEPQEHPLKSSLHTEEDEEKDEDDDDKDEDSDNEDPKDDEDKNLEKTDDGEADKNADDTDTNDGEEKDDEDGEEKDDEDDKEKLPPNAKKKGEVEIYEEYMGRTKYAVVHLKNGKLRADIFDHMIDIYNASINVVGEVIEITPSEVHETESRMNELKKIRGQKSREAKVKLNLLKARKAAAVSEPISEEEKETDCFVINQNGIKTFDVYFKGEDVMQKRKNGEDVKILTRTTLQQLIHTGALRLEKIPEPKYTMNA